MDVTPFLPLTTAPQALLQSAAREPDRPRFWIRSDAADGDEWTAVTFAEHATAMRRVGAWVRERVGDTGFGTIFAPNSHRYMEAALGLQAAGLAMVPIYPASTPDQAGYVLEHSGARVLFVATAELLGRVFEAWPSCAALEAIVVLDDTDPHAVAQSVGGPDAAALEDKLVHWSQVLARGAELDDADPSRLDAHIDAADLDAPAIMLYTSGTTGRPKGVPLTHRNVGVNGSDWLTCCAPGLPEEGIDLLWLPMSHIFGFGEACFGNRLGWTSWLCDHREVLALMPTVRPTVFMSVPAYWEKLAAAGADAPDDATADAALRAATGGRLRFCLSGGAGLAREVKERFARAGTPIMEGYGLTETSPTLTINRPDDFRFDAVGKPVPSIELKLADDGEILARGASVFSGYHDDPEATRTAFSDGGWFHTGDLGRMTDDGFLQIIGRKKEILVTAGGKNVPPANIEGQFAHDPLFTHVVVYGDGKKYLVAGMWLDEDVAAARLRQAGADPSDDTARRALVQPVVDAVNAKLARFEQIKTFALMSPPLSVAGGTLTSTLKLRRAKIYEAFGAQFESLYA